MGNTRTYTPSKTASQPHYQPRVQHRYMSHRDLNKLEPYRRDPKENRTASAICNALKKTPDLPKFTPQKYIQQPSLFKLSLKHCTTVSKKSSLTATTQTYKRRTKEPHTIRSTFLTVTQTNNFSSYLHQIRPRNLYVYRNSNTNNKRLQSGT